MQNKIVKSLCGILTAALLLGSTSCIGSFTLTNRLLSWNNHVGNKFVNELVFFAFWILPVYEVSGLADILVLNSIEFWSGRNPMTASATEVKASNGDRVLITPEEDGYALRNLDSEEEMRLCYDADIDGWEVEYQGERHTLFMFVDNTHIALPAPDGTGFQTVELSDRGLADFAALAAK